MNERAMHTFHIPVLGLSYSIDTPVKVARYGISSVVSIIEDELVEKMRAYHCARSNSEYVPITIKDQDYRARRITAYLNLLDRIVKQQVQDLKRESFENGSEIVKYFEMLPDHAALRVQYNEMNTLNEGPEKEMLQKQLRDKIVPGAIDVNIMSKIDNLSYASDGKLLPDEFSDALSAFRGFAKSDLKSSVVLSAGYNPRLYNYIERFPDFYPDIDGQLQKKIILKVSDYRSALIQGKILAKKGIWVSEFRIESGLNCGGHAFPTDGFLLGPILDEFRLKRNDLASELFNMCNGVNKARGNNVFKRQPSMRITVQGGIGTANEDQFLLEHYEVDGTGWGSPFLLVPEATNVEEETLQQLVGARKEDFFLSGASPLGVPFHNFRRSTSEQQRVERIEKGRPGSPCYKKFLASDTEFTATPICTASRQYQDLKIRQLIEKNLPDSQFMPEFKKITDKDCLCEGLGASVLLKDSIPVAHNLSAVAICPGPNLAYFSGVYSLTEMIDHIYGRKNILNSRARKNMFINELQLYVDYLRSSIENGLGEMTIKQSRYLQTFRVNLLAGIAYYKNLIPRFRKEAEQYREQMRDELTVFQNLLSTISIPSPTV